MASYDWLYGWNRPCSAESSPAQLRQNSGRSSTSTVNSSSRPSIIANDSTHFAAAGSEA